MEPLAATVLAVPFMAGRELLLRMRYENVMVFSLVSLRGLHKQSKGQRVLDNVSGTAHGTDHCPACPGKRPDAT